MERTLRSAGTSSAMASRLNDRACGGSITAATSDGRRRRGPWAPPRSLPRRDYPPRPRAEYRLPGCRPRARFVDAVDRRTNPCNYIRRRAGGRDKASSHRPRATPRLQQRHRRRTGRLRSSARAATRTARLYSASDVEDLHCSAKPSSRSGSRLIAHILARLLRRRAAIALRNPFRVQVRLSGAACLRPSSHPRD